MAIAAPSACRDAHRSDAARKCLSVDPVPITDEIVWRERLMGNPARYSLQRHFGQR